MKSRGIDLANMSLLWVFCRAVLASVLMIPAMAFATVAVTPIAINPLEQSAFNGPVATFTSDDVPAQPIGNYSATIDWGDGTTTPGTITQPGGAGTAFSVAGTHTYAEDGIYTMTVTVTDTFAGTTVPASISITVNEQSLSATSVNNTVAEGVVFNGSTATFLDPPNTDPPANFAATIDWGDGTTSPGTFTQPGGSGTTYVISGTHTYADEGSFTVTTTAFESFEPGFTVSVGGTMTVTESDVLAGQPANFTATQFSQYSGPVGTFTDTFTGNIAADFTATINWGDGSAPTAGTVSGGGGTFTVSGNHIYTTLGTFTVTSVLTDDAPGTATATATSAATVIPPAGAAGIPTLSAWGLIVLATLTLLAAMIALRRRAHSATHRAAGRNERS